MVGYLKSKAIKAHKKIINMLSAILEKPINRFLFLTVTVMATLWSIPTAISFLLSLVGLQIAPSVIYWGWAFGVTPFLSYNKVFGVKK